MPAAPRPFVQLPFAQVPEAPRLPHPYFETPARTVEVSTPHFGTVKTHVRICGQGPPLLLVHGLMTTSYSFRYVLEPLGRRFTVYAPDLVGAGRTDKPDAEYSPAQVADWLGALIEALGIRGCAAIGNSLGGYLAMQLVLRRPAALGRLVNLHSPGVPTARMWALYLALRALPRPERILGALVARDPERWVHHNVHYYDETLKSRQEHHEYAAPLRSPDGVRAFFRMLQQTLDVRAMGRFVRELAARERFPIPLLLVYAPRDPMVPPRVGEALHRARPDAKLVRLERGSHFAHVDVPELFLAAIEPFLSAAP